MGAPLVRRDEFDAEIKKLASAVRKTRAEGKAKAQDPDLAFVTRADLAVALAPVYAALEITDADFEAPAGDAEATDPAGVPTPLEVAEAAGEAPAGDPDQDALEAPGDAEDPVE